jgi:hypothetical protein
VLSFYKGFWGGLNSSGQRQRDCFKTRFGIYGLCTRLTLALVFAAGLVPAFYS